MAGAGHTVEAHGVHALQRRRAAEQVPAQQARPGHTVIAHSEGHDQEGLRAFLLQVPGQLRNTLVGGQSLRQEAGEPLVQEPVCLLEVHLRRGPLAALWRGSQIGEHIGTEGLRRFQGQAAGSPQKLLRLGLLSCRQVGAQGEGVGLDGPASGLQIGPVDGPDLLRAGQIGPLAPLSGTAGLCGEIGAHGTVKQQGLPLRQVTANLHHPRTFLAISTDWRASLA